jgi:5'-nucleotidase
MMGIPSMAFSVVEGSKSVYDMAAKVANKLSRLILKHKLPQRVFLNVNVPALSNHKPKFELTRLGRRVYGKVIPSGVDPRGQLFYWLAGDIPKGIPEPGTDMSAVKSGKISITPLSVDSTSALLMDVSNWKL